MSAPETFWDIQVVLNGHILKLSMRVWDEQTRDTAHTFATECAKVWSTLRGIAFAKVDQQKIVGRGLVAYTSVSFEDGAEVLAQVLPSE